MLPHATDVFVPARRSAFVLGLFLLLLAVGPACAAPDGAAPGYLQKQVLSAIASGAGEPDGLFGWSVAVDGDLAVAGDVRLAGLPGRIRTYQRNGTNWTYLPGHDVPLSGDSGAVMAFREGTLMLAMYRSAAPSAGFLKILRHTEAGWTQEFSISTDHAFDSVATTDHIAVAGESGCDDAAGANQGCIWILRRQPDEHWQLQILTPTTPQAGAQFGASVAIVAGAIVVGAPRENVTGTSDTHENAGAAYVYELTIDTWNEVARLVEPDVGDRTGNSFGSSVAISGADPSTPDRLLASRRSNEATGRPGIVRSYTRTSGAWIPRATISAPSPNAVDNFGCSLALDGDWAVIGACYSDSAAPHSGAILLAHFNDDFTAVSSLTERTDPQAAAEDYLGYRVDIDREGPTVIAGNLLANLYGNSDQGVVLIGRSQSGEVPVLTRALDLGQGLTGAYASVVAVDGDTLLIGAPGEDVGLQQERGAVYVYRRAAGGQYAFESRLLAPDGMAGDGFGSRLALRGDLALITAIGRSHQGVDGAGAVYAFHRTGGSWALEAVLLPPAPVYEDAFGFSLAFADASTALIGEFGENVSVFERSAGGQWTPVQSIPHRAWSLQADADRASLADPNTNGNIGDVAIYARVDGLWQLQDTLNGSLPDQGFGREIALDGDLLAASSSSLVTPTLLYRHTANGWLPEASLFPDDFVGDTYCAHVSISVDGLAISCRGADGEGAVYVFEKTPGSWTQAQKLVLQDPHQNDNFGSTVLFGAGGSLLIGARGRDLDFLDQGAVYIYASDSLFANGFED